MTYTQVCPQCGQVADGLYTAIKDGAYVSSRCEKCLANFTRSAQFARKYERDRQREDYRKDIIQPWEPEFVKAYPDKAREYYNDDAMRKYG